jgi:hypothetical protein
LGERAADRRMRRRLLRTNLSTLFLPEAAPVSGAESVPSARSAALRDLYPIEIGRVPRAEGR